MSLILPSNKLSVVQLASGGYIDLLDPQPEDIHLSDIAFGLSHICRFTGHTKHFYSVAQHSVMVSNLVDVALAKEALLHDASEAYIGDVSTPLKNLLPEYKKIEGRLEAVISDKFGLPQKKNPLVKKADLIALVTEKRDLMTTTPKDRELWGDLFKIKPCVDKIHPQPSEVARHSFLLQFKRILADEGRAHADIQKEVLA